MNPKNQPFKRRRPGIILWLYAFITRSTIVWLYGCPITDGDAVRGMTFMMIDDDEAFRTWRQTTNKAGGFQ